MEITTDLTPKLLKAEAKDRIYHVKGKIIKLLAPQNFTRPFTYKKDGWGSVTRVEQSQDGTPTALRSPRRKKRIRKGESEVKDAACWTFLCLDKNGKPFDASKAKDEKDWKDVHVFLPWGTHFGIFKKSLHRSLEAQRKLRYDAAPLALMRVFPTLLDIGKAPCESMNGELPEIVMETRHTSRKQPVMVEVFFDYLKDREFQCLIEVDSECPINEEKLVGLLKSLNTLDTIGASKRGRLLINEIHQVKLDDDEVKGILRGEEQYRELEPVLQALKQQQQTKAVEPN